jgi:catechol 2,3-dioxygenase-like lactoylglutathione lyase family enzyme
MSLTLLLRCNDLAETARFYGEVLGFAVADTAERTATAERFGARIIFTEADLWGGEPSLTGTIYFTVPDLSDLFAQIGPRAAVEWGPEETAYGSREFAIRDCNGYYLAFREAV